MFIKSPIVVSLLTLLLGWAAPVLAEPDFSAIDHLVFVVLRDSTTVAVIDSRTDRIAGSLDIGLVPSQLVLAPTRPLLAATDGTSSRILLVDLATGGRTTIDLDFPARRLVVSPDGLRLAASDLDGGHLAILSFEDGHVLEPERRQSPMSDLVFAGDNTTLATAGPATVALLRPQGVDSTVATSGSPPGPAHLLRSANGRQIFAHPGLGGPIAVIETRTGRAGTMIPAGPGVLASSGSGSYLLVLDPAAATLSIVHGDDLSSGPVLPASTDMAAAYSGWFDSVAFVAGRHRASLLVFDLWRLDRTDDIPLPGVPGPGTVTTDGAKLYLPLELGGQIAMVDTRSRRLAATIAVPGHPVATVVAAGYGICH
jgi:DNA-binding beta-propeller fold protein YncE